MNSYLCVGLGSAIGGILRYWISNQIAERCGTAFPWGTIFVNVSGSFLVGFIGTATENEGRPASSLVTREFVMIGLFGGYTTFSAFSLQTLNLAREGQWTRAGANAFLSFGVCLGAVWMGHLLARCLSRWF